MKRQTSKSTTLHLFGGGRLLEAAATAAARLGAKPVIRTSKRLLGTFDIKMDLAEVHIADSLSTVLKKGPAPKNSDLGFSISAPWIFDQSIINLFKGRLFNLHYQALPKNRGGGGRSWNILMGDYKCGATIHAISKVIDAGEIFAQLHVDIPTHLKTPRDVDERLEEEIKPFMTGWLQSALQGNEKPLIKKRDDREDTYWPRLNAKIHGWIDWSWSLTDIEKFICAFSYPHEGAKTYLNDSIISIKKVEVELREGQFHPFQNGLIFKNDGNFWIAHKDGVIRIHEFEVLTKPIRIHLGDRLYTPLRLLEESMLRRIDYMPDGAIKDKLNGN